MTNFFLPPSVGDWVMLDPKKVEFSELGSPEDYFYVISCDYEDAIDGKILYTIGSEKTRQMAEVPLDKLVTFKQSTGLVPKDCPAFLNDKGARKIADFTPLNPSTGDEISVCSYHPEVDQLFTAKILCLGCGDYHFMLSFTDEMINNSKQNYH